MPPLCPRTIARHALVAAVFNTVLALAITASGDQPFAVNLLYSQLIGMTIWALIDGGRFVLSGDGWPGAPKMAAVVLAAVLAGYFGGSALGDLLLGHEPLHGFARFPKAMTGFLLLSLAAGVGGAFARADDAGLPEPGFLFEERIDEIRRTERGLMLLGARSTATDRDWTHLSVRRLIDWLEAQLAADLAWAPFEPNDALLWSAMANTARRRLQRQRHLRQPVVERPLVHVEDICLAFERARTSAPASISCCIRVAAFCIRCR